MPRRIPSHHGTEGTKKDVGEGDVPYRFQIAIPPTRGMGERLFVCAGDRTKVGDAADSLRFGGDAKGSTGPDSDHNWS